MTTVATDQLTETIQNLKGAAESALNTESPGSFADFEKYLSEVEAYIREMQQSFFADEAKAAIKNLEKCKPLSETDLAVIRTFLVADAESYLKHENNYGDWKRELTRLMDDLTTRSNMVDRETIGDMRGVLKDAMRLVPDIRNYLEERERVEKFSNALKTLDDSSCAMLARLMKEQLRSQNR